MGYVPKKNSAGIGYLGGESMFEAGISAVFELGTRYMADTVATALAQVKADVLGDSIYTGHLDNLGARGTYQSPGTVPELNANGWPVPAQSIVMVLRWGDSDDRVIQLVIPRITAESPRIRARYNGTWYPWAMLPKESDVRKIVESYLADLDLGGTAPSSVASLKTVPLSLTVGQGDLSAAATGSARYPIEYAPRISRYRVHVLNINPEVGSVRSGASLTGLWVGPIDSSGKFTSAPTRVAPAAEVPANRTGYTTDWIQGELGGGTNYAVSLGWTSTAAPVRNFGYGWTTPNTGDATALAPSLTAVSAGLPFHVWIEAEVPATVPTIAVFGSSSAAGQGATRPLVDSVVSRYARERGALPIHYAAPGSRLDKWTDPTAYKWTSFEGTAPPDAVLWAMGSNDAYQGDTLGTMQSETQTVLDILRGLGARVFYATSIPPRAATTAEVNTVRTGYNTWLGNSDLFRDVFDFSAALSSNGSTMNAAYDSGDGVHYNEAGHAATLATMTRPVVNDAMATMKSLLNQDTGWKDITGQSVAGLVTAGTISVRRTGSTVWVNFTGVQLSSRSVWQRILGLPSGYRPDINTFLLQATSSASTGNDQVSVYPTGSLHLTGHTDASDAMNFQVSYPTSETFPAE